MAFRDLLGKDFLYFDGAMGTMLQAAGLQAGELPEIWNIQHPEKVQAVHGAYLAAGAQIIKTNTFGANSLKLTDTGVSVAEVFQGAVKNIRSAIVQEKSQGTIPCDREIFVALDMGPTGKLLQPFGDLAFAQAVEIYKEEVQAGVKAGADIILIETMSDSYEAKAAILAAKENSQLPIVCTFTFDLSGKLLNGADVETAFSWPLL
jgi:5-methyltetrahydrofolate--homocysteine methyltransferase